MNLGRVVYRLLADLVRYLICVKLAVSIPVAIVNLGAFYLDSCDLLLACEEKHDDSGIMKMLQYSIYILADIWSVQVCVTSIDAELLLHRLNEISCAANGTMIAF